MKTITTLASVPFIFFAAWTATFISHPNAERLEVVPEWNGPDYKVHYVCQGSFDKMEGLDMQRKDNTVVVNYGALGRRRGLRSFKCNTPMTSTGAATR